MFILFAAANRLPSCSYAAFMVHDKNRKYDLSVKKYAQVQTFILNIIISNTKNTSPQLCVGTSLLRTCVLSFFPYFLS